MNAERPPDVDAEIWTRFLDGAALDAADEASLVAALDAADDRGARLHADGRLHAMLDSLGRGAAREPELVAEVARRITRTEAFSQRVERRLDDLQRARAARGDERQRRTGGAWLAAGFAFAVAASVLAVIRRDDAPPGPSIELARAPTAGAPILSGALEIDGASRGPGQALLPGESARAATRACLETTTGVRACVEAGAEVTARAGDGRALVELRGGELTAIADRAAAAPALLVAGAALAARDAAFAVRATADVPATVTVLRGRVRVVSALDPRAAGPATARRPASPLAAGPAIAAGQQATLGAAGPAALRALDDAELGATWARLAAATATPTAAAPPAARGVAAMDPSALLRLQAALRAEGRDEEADGILERLRGVAGDRADVVAALATAKTATTRLAPAARPALYRIAAGDRVAGVVGGVPWAADAFFNHPANLFHVPDAPIDRTADDAIYRRYRWDPPGPPRLEYNLPVDDGAYEVRLHFADLFHTWPDQRVFSVSIEDRVVLPDLDVVREVGPFTALVKAFVVEVRDGRLDIGFDHRPNARSLHDDPMIAAIEVFAVPPGTSAPEPIAWVPPTPPLPLPPSDTLYRVNVGGPEHVDAEGRLWEADNYYVESGIRHYDYGRGDVAGTDVDFVYQSHRFGIGRPIGYRFPVAPGAYSVRLHFAEISGQLDRPGRRVFDVLVEGQPVLRRFDIVATAGFRRALVETFDVEVTDGVLDVELRAIVDNPCLSAIEIVPR